MSKKDLEINQVNNDTIRETSRIRELKYLTLQGGGMKGIAYVGVIEELANTGVLAQLEEIAGSSAGGIVALLVAIGCTPAEIRTHMLALDFRDFQDREGPGWIESTRLSNLLHPLGLALDSIDDKLKLLSSIPGIGKTASYLMTPVSAGLKVGSALTSVVSGIGRIEEGLGVNSNLGLYKGDVLSYWLANIVAQKTGKPNITFAELAKLSGVENSPFKKLTLTGSNLTANRLEYFNAENTPDMSLVDAARISASYPGAFQPVKRPDKDGVMSVYVDGGLVENLPDVFNQPPYVTAEQRTNPRALAVAFKTLKESKSKENEIRNLFDLAKALYATARSEKSFYDKYGSNIVFVDTGDVNTLEFTLSKEKKEILVNRGQEGVQNAFKNMLEAEENPHYSKLTLEELARIRIGLLAEKRNNLKLFNEENRENELLLVTKSIDHYVKNKKISEEELLSLYRKKEEELQKRLKSKNANLMSESEIIDSFQKKFEEFDRVRRDLIEKLKILKLVMRGLQLRKEEVLARFSDNDFNNPFSKALNDPALNLLHEQIQQNRKRNAHLELKDWAQKEVVDREYRELIKQRSDALLTLRDQFAKSKSSVEAQFFEDLLRDRENPDFKIPNSSDSIQEYYGLELKFCKTLADQTDDLITKMKAEREGFKKAHQLYAELEAEKKDKLSMIPELQKTKADRLSVLIELRKDLNNSLQEKSLFLAKLNYTLAQKLPFFSGLISGFFKLVSFASFVAFLPLAIPAVAIAKGARYFVRKPETQTVIDRFINFFRKTDIDFEKKLRGFTKTTAEFVDIMTKNYTKDKSENSYIYKLFSLYLKESGLKLSDLLVKKAHETDEQYQERLKRIEKELAVPNASAQVLITRGYDQFDKKPKSALEIQGAKEAQDVKAEKKIQEFRQKVLQEALKLNNHNAKYEEKHEHARKIELAQQENLSQIDLDYVNEIKKKLQREASGGRALTFKEKREYTKSLIALAQDFNESFRVKYLRSIDPVLKNLHTITLKIKEDKALSPEEVLEYQKYIGSKRKATKSRSSEEQKIFDNFEKRYVKSLPPTPPEYKSILDSFTKERKAHLEGTAVEEKLLKHKATKKSKSD